MWCFVWDLWDLCEKLSETVFKGKKNSEKNFNSVKFKNWRFLEKIYKNIKFHAANLSLQSKLKHVQQSWHECIYVKINNLPLFIVIFYAQKRKLVLNYNSSKIIFIRYTLYVIMHIMMLQIVSYVSWKWFMNRHYHVTISFLWKLTFHFSFAGLKEIFKFRVAVNNFRLRNQMKRFLTLGRVFDGMRFQHPYEKGHQNSIL